LVSENGYGSLPKGSFIAAEERVSLLLCGKEIHFSAFFLNENIQHKVGGKVLDMETYHPVYIFNTSH
jgi:hypothetical protein